MDFEILIDNSFKQYCSTDLAPIENKSLLSLCNDFEDGKWRYQKLHNFIWNNIAQTSLSSQEREKLIGQPESLLNAAAKSLRLIEGQTIKKTEGSELAEIFMYGLMRHHYKALPVVPKIFYKQNVNDNAKGADSVHIVIENENDFSIWFGEAKFYSDIEDARLGSIVQSVMNSLDSEKLKKENSIITGLRDLDDLVKNPDLLEKIKNALSSKQSLDVLKPRIHIPILIMYECGITASSTNFDHVYRGEISNYHVQRANSYFEKQVKKLSTEIHLYQEIQFHLVLFPVPDKMKIVERFIKSAQFRRESD